MIYVTGDIHGDISRFKSKEAKKLKKGDTLIICGDFGFIWNGSKKEKKLLEKLGRRKYNIAFVDGFYENFSLLSQYPIQQWNGGEVHKISGNLVHLIRGCIYNIENKKIFAFGGGEPSDAAITKPGYSDWYPNAQEMQRGIKNLEKVNYNVDYIITYEPPEKIKAFMYVNDSINTNIINSYLDQLNQKLKFKMWYFGQCHRDKVITSSHTVVFESILKVKE